ncbi:hypothetical protein MSSAC_2130 [Methanosarcina siciliae C2J]|uniref:SnoaL-like domain-containing protein n=1 Tax=Methanosarcina siciliae C2J TaxID=1434118 RepID=A0A0E3PML5_9EURY|nr:nuclear transport factor 2 family protein [Methanosarcina siciliae]AKB36720.1 hypothetical protein MSSAC_2130 [Methanosarcina siciliae C2J]
MTVVETLKDFFILLQKEDTEKLLSIFVGEPVIDTPMEGRITGREEFISFVGRQHQWLKGHDVGQQFVEITVSVQRVCVELLLYLQHDTRSMDLPVAIVADLDGDKVSAIRIYHSMWPLTGRHRVRKPLLEPAKGLEEPDFVKQYMQALDSGDAATIVNLFEDDGYAREPSSSEYTHSGRSGLNNFYSTILKDGGISLKHCTATFDGKRAVIEYIAAGWGKTELPPQAGVAVYELGKNWKMHAARIYDDVTPPGEAA